MNLSDLRAFPDAFPAYKRPVSVEVEFAEDAGTIQTREGQVAFEVGDAILTGVEGERWPVSRKHFFDTYSPELPTRAGQSGLYRKRLIWIWAWRTPSPLNIPLPSGRGILHAESGDFVVQHDINDWSVVGASIFAQTYEKPPADV